MRLLSSISEQRSESNTVTGLPEGMVFELTATNVGAPTSVDFPSNVAAISDVMSDLVTVLNDIASSVADVASPLGGELGNDSGARGLKRALSSLSTEIVMPNAANGEPQTLGDLGLTVNADGTFSLDDARLSE
ncbi:MAG: flagellar filament capping protein FliD, partial [Erythrobacter sp.]